MNKEKRRCRFPLIALAEWTGSSAGLAVFIAALVLLVTVLCFAFLPAFSGRNAVGSGGASLIKPLLFSIKQAFCSTLMALAVGLPAAFFTARRRFFCGRFIRAFSAVPLCIPPILVALGYVQAFGMNGIVNRVLMSWFHLEEPPLTFLYSFTGIVVAHGFYNFPIIMRTVADTWQNLNQDEHDAARLLGAGKFRVFRTVTLVQLAPAVATGAVIVFLYCFFSFVIVLLFNAIGGSSLEVEIYQAARNTLDFPLASRLAIVETGAALVMVALYVLLGKRGRRAVARGTPLRVEKLHGIVEYLGLFVLLAAVCVFFVLPLSAIVVRSFIPGADSMSGLIALIHRTGFVNACLHSLEASVCTAVLSVLIGFTFAVVSRRADPRRKGFVLQLLPLIPMAVSSVVLSYGLMRLFPGSGSPAQLVLAEALLYWPFAEQQIARSMDRISENVEAAALLLSSRRTDSVFRVLLPLSRRGIFSGFAFCMAMSIGDASIPLVLSLPRYDTLALYTYRLSGSYRFEEACGCGFILMMTGIGLFALTDMKTKQEKHILRGSHISGKKEV